MKRSYSNCITKKIEYYLNEILVVANIVIFKVKYSLKSLFLFKKKRNYLYGYWTKTDKSSF